MEADFSKVRIDYFGNKEILKEHKTAFLCSRKYPPEIVLKAYDWAIEKRDSGNCVVSGFHSQIEKDVFHFLLKGTQPIVLVLARGLKKRWEPEIIEAVGVGRLLVISPFDKSVKRVSALTAKKRNEVILELTNEVYIPYMDPNGKLQKLVEDNNTNN